MARESDLPHQPTPSGAAQAPGPPARRPERERAPGRPPRRSAIERFIVRVIATVGVVGVGVALGAILRSSNEQGWIIGLVVAVVTVILSGILRWASRQL
jgi:hypothetical protein